MKKEWPIFQSPQNISLQHCLKKLRQEWPVCLSLISFADTLPKLHAASFTRVLSFHSPTFYDAPTFG